ncbi:MAG: lysophospholipid acyltransferase family protein [Thermoplasmata archaeon]|nr:MAG: lysophospholipid acyltransferase family protein [Thermoplasmata archaeon]
MLKELLEDTARWFFLYPCRMMIYRLPLRVNYVLGHLMGFALYHLMREKRKIMQQELLTIFNEKISRKDVDRIVKKTFSLISKENIEILLFPRLTPEEVKRSSVVEGLNHLNKALRENRGVILLIAHLGNYRFVLPALGYRGYPMNQIGAPPTVWKELEKNVSRMKARALEFELECERSLPAEFIYYDTFMRPAFGRLARNEVLVIAGDSVGAGKRIAVDFLNRIAQISISPFNLARKTGAPLLPVFVIRNEDNTHTVKIEERISLPIIKEKEKDEEDNVKRFVQLLEDYVKKYPDHYLKHLWWVQRRRHVDPVPFMSPRKA